MSQSDQVAESEIQGDKKSELLVHRVTSGIRDLILSGELQPGTRIGQDALAKRFGTSRLPVRDALRQIESEGLIILTPNSSARVAKLELQEFAEIYRIRELIEPLALSESIPNMSDEQIESLEAAVREIERTRDSDVFLKLDREFHLSSYRAANMPQLESLVARFWNTTQHYRRAYTKLIWEQGNWIINSEHRLLMEAIKRRDPVDAGQILRMHIRRTRKELARHEELFGTLSTPRRKRKKS
ncbi:MAG TPA: GntR family transcriptional regulator [Xanthomonadales bacterium]|nr:GntR family transcriptional regulator [Xanthomonadales bacterium]